MGLLPFAGAALDTTSAMTDLRREVKEIESYMPDETEAMRTVSVVRPGLFVSAPSAVKAFNRNNAEDAKNSP